MPKPLDARENTLIGQLEALRRMLLRMVIFTAALYPAAYFLSPYAIERLIARTLPAELGRLHYFAPLEVFLVRLKFALILALILAWPWNMRQLWNFLLPALYPRERKALAGWLLGSTLLFFGGAAFCIGLILPMLMKFSGGFATPELQPVLGLANFLSLAGWLILAFGVMFQTPAAVLLAVRFGLVSSGRLASLRPYLLTGILILAAILTPPDVLSQLLLALPTWLLFEIGLLAARRMERG